jgi:carboxymethylenebutenolidase
VVVLHGAGGTLFDGPEMRRVSRHLAESGNAVYLVHYFDRTGTLFARDRTMQKNFGVWRETVRDSIVAIQELRGSTAPVGIYGYSLGGFLALFTASDNPRVAAVVEHAGGVWNGKEDRIRKMPPVLMVHGERDGRVSFDKYARPLVTLLRSRGAPVEIQFFPAESHVFTQDAMLKVRQEAARFFRKHLRG